MVELKQNFKRSYIFGGGSVIGFSLAVTALAKTDINPLIWLSALFILFLVLSYSGLYRPKITCGNCSANLYKSVEMAFKKLKTQNALKQCPECGATFEYPERTT